MNVLARFKYKGIRKRLEREITNLANAVWTQEDTELIKRDIIKKAKTGKTGFIFRVDYNKEYAKKYNKRSGNYMKKSGKMLNSIKTKVVKKKGRNIHMIYFSNKDAEEIAKYHNTGTAKGRKIRAWWGLSPTSKRKISKIVRSRLRIR